MKALGTVPGMQGGRPKVGTPVQPAAATQCPAVCVMAAAQIPLDVGPPNSDLS